MVQATIRHDGQRALDAALTRLGALGRSPRPMFQAFANYGENSTRLRFERQAGPDGAAWKPSRRAAKTGGKTLILSRRLLRSITSVYGGDFAAWGSNVVYAPIHQLGGVIERAPHSVRVRLRTDARGSLLRQAGAKKLAVFARDRHTRARESWHEVQAYKIRMPARPFLGVNREDLWAMGRLSVQVIQAAAGGGGAR
ncbi:Mu-like prophage protein gpG [Bordetella ansorpii]|uniref:Mu-like prophage protein gpG n=1 Tax=Bordetella ansorpii TaxID=288768 RepID=A0A157SW55_9BORD|nr:phage virion morphogenesis protein [Bordetella ansorpii]SAI74571.1 Mu-like prophage protein gpG [Bordetella ansorpii]